MGTCSFCVYVFYSASVSSFMLEDRALEIVLLLLLCVTEQHTMILRGEKGRKSQYG